MLVLPRLSIKHERCARNASVAAHNAKVSSMGCAVRIPRKRMLTRIQLAIEKPSHFRAEKIYDADLRERLLRRCELDMCGLREWIWIRANRLLDRKSVV